MSGNNNINSNSADQPQKIEFTITENIEKLGIKEFFLKDKDFLITWSNGRNSCIDFIFKSSSISKNIDLIEKTLKKEVGGKNIDNETFDSAIGDIEDQLVKRSDEIFNLNKTKTCENNSNNEFLKDVSNLREQFENSDNPLLEWQNQVYKKYNKLKDTVNRIYPNAWSIMQFNIAAKTILNIEGNKLPFLGIIIAIPSSLKTTFLNFFKVYDHTFYSDIFTPNSLVSHNSALTKEQLEKDIDMLPKIKNKLVMIPEMAPLFTGNEDVLYKIIGIIIRLMDGDGFESDSGAHGHRGYPATMFSWIGAVVEIPPKIWRILSTLGFKIYFLRPELPGKSIDDLVKIALDSKSSEKNQEIKEALLDYLKVFDAAPIITDITRLDENAIVKVKWDDEIETATTDGEQYIAISYIAKIAKLLASLRGDVYVHTSKSHQSTKKQQTSQGESEEQQIFYQTEQLDYETDSVIIEDPSRATIQLRNLALANAISQGRNYIKIEDVNLVVKVALSTTRTTRKKVFDLLLKEKGNLTTSKIVKELGFSEPTARKTMREFQALGISTVSSTSSYANSELTLVLDSKFNWFLSEEFQNLRKEAYGGSTDIPCQSNIESGKMYLPIIAKTLPDSYYPIQKACDSNCHMLKANLPAEADIKNNDNSEIITESPTINQKSENEINTNQKNDDGNKNIENYIIEENATITINSNSYKDQENIIQKNSASLGPETFQHVTPSQENCHAEKEDHYTTKKQLVPTDVIEDILKVIRDENGIIALVNALQLACRRSEIVKEYFKDEKLVARHSRKVRNLFVEINRHSNIEVIKKKPALVVKWIEKEVIMNN